MAATAQQIIDAIDDAIYNWADKPVSITTLGGRSKTYRNLKELIEARREYASLLRTSGGATGFQIHHVEAGGST